MAAVQTRVNHPATFDTFIEGVGHATVLGKFSMTSSSTVDIATRTPIGPSPTVFTAANGDQILADASGRGTPIAGTPYVSIVETFTINGGTGRFANATGSIRMERLLNLVTLISSATFAGQINLP
jgi:hypothetical protein